jgi:hypothetical protein
MTQPASMPDFSTANSLDVTRSGSNPRPTDYRPIDLDGTGCIISFVVSQGDWSPNDSGQKPGNPGPFRVIGVE